MHARLSTYRYSAPPAAPDADPQRYVRLLGDQPGCRGAWELTAPDPGDGPEESVDFSLWDTREQAEAAGERARAQVLALYEAEHITPAGPPQARVFGVVAASGPSA